MAWDGMGWHGGKAMRQKKKDKLVLLEASENHL